MNTQTLRGRLMEIAATIVGNVMPPPTAPELDLDATIESEERTRERLKNERLERKWVQITASFSRWVSDLFSDIPNGDVQDPAMWEMKHGSDSNGRTIAWLGIKGSHSIFIGGTEVCLENIQFAVQGYIAQRGAGGLWEWIDSNEILDRVASNHLRYGVADNDGNFIEVQSKMHLARLVALGQI